MQPLIIEYLEWDSNFFRKRIGKISIPNNYPYNSIETIINSAKSDSFELIYLFEESENIGDCINQLSDKLTDIKINFKKEIKHSHKLINNITVLDSDHVDDNILKLSYNSGQHSRFLTDPHFGKDSFEKLYKTWITKSVSREIADQVFVCKEADKIIGFITLKVGKNSGVIGLIAIDDSYQGRGIGKELVFACENYLHENNITNLEVATQNANKNAMNFYKKIGFEINKIINIYHLWL